MLKLLSLKPGTERLLIAAVILLAPYRLHAEGGTPLVETKSFVIILEDPVAPKRDLSIERARAQQLAQVFQTRVVPAIPTEIWQDVLRAPRVTMRLRADLPMDGLFNPPPASTDVSRGLEVLMRTSLLINGDSETILAHEVFPAIHYVLHRDEPAWLREGMAQVFEWRAMSVKGHTERFNTRNLTAAFRDIQTPLEGEFVVGRANPAQYGHDLLYFYYLYQQCGGDALFWRIARSAPGNFGRATIDAALSMNTSPQCRSFVDSATSFEVARVHNEIRYDVKENTKQYTLRPPSALTKATALERWDPSADVLRAFDPRLVQVSALTPAVLSGVGKQFRVFLLQSKMPYAVLELGASTASVDKSRFDRALILRKD